MLNDSTRRSLRTAFDVAVAVLAVATVVVPLLGSFGVSTENVIAWTGMVATATAVVSKVRNKLEDLGILPAVLKAPRYEGEHEAD